MADFGWFQGEAGKRGKVLCMICFEEKKKDQMVPVKDKPGVVWDICLECEPQAGDLDGQASDVRQ